MWSRKLLKTRAKEILRQSYWKAFLVSIVIAIVGGGRIAGPPNFNWNFDSHSHDMTGGFAPPIPAFPIVLVSIILIIVFLVMLFVLAIRIFLGYPLEVGGRRFFIDSARQDPNLNDLGFAFEKGKYLNIIKTMLWRDFLNFLWFLLFFIPGIVKFYAYAMVPYLLAENPKIGYKRAVTLSKQMTSGNKFKMFVLDLSFIGWYLLGILALFIGVLFLMPYINATKAELYLVLRQNAIDHGLTSPEELC